ncbi:type II toxin-antitoxin system VapC family toxin [Candidatus Pacearchaeota archaeon]|nr:type II toxin-antitoxin system VapC family toxin [Candidatus Pacearchaeota archaeon]
MILLDTSFLIGYYNEKDVHHGRAKEIMDGIYSGNYGRPVISDYIFDELINIFLSRTQSLASAVKVGEDALYFSDIVYISKEIFKDAWEIFKSQKNTKFSFTDCTILAMMQEMKIKYIATFDEDFKKVEGIRVI